MEAPPSYYRGRRRRKRTASSRPPATPVKPQPLPPSQQSKRCCACRCFDPHLFPIPISFTGPQASGVCRKHYMWLRRHFGLEKVSLHTKCQNGVVPKRCASLLQMFAGNGIEFTVVPSLDGPVPVARPAPAKTSAKSSSSSAAAAAAKFSSSRPHHPQNDAQRERKQLDDAFAAEDDMMLEALGMEMEMQVAQRAAERARQANARADAVAAAVQQRHYQMRMQQQQQQQHQQRSRGVGLVAAPAPADMSANSNATPTRRWREVQRSNPPASAPAPLNPAIPLYTPTASRTSVVPPLVKDGKVPRHRMFMPEVQPAARPDGSLPRHVLHMVGGKARVAAMPPVPPSACDSVPTGRYELDRRVFTPTRAESDGDSDLDLAMEGILLSDDELDVGHGDGEGAMADVADMAAEHDLLVCRPTPVVEVPVVWSVSSLSAGARLTPASTLSQAPLPAIQDGAYAALGGVAVAKPVHAGTPTLAPAPTFGFGKADHMGPLSDDELDVDALASPFPMWEAGQMGATEAGAVDEDMGMGVTVEDFAASFFGNGANAPVA